MTEWQMSLPFFAVYKVHLYQTFVVYGLFAAVGTVELVLYVLVQRAGYIDTARFALLLQPGGHIDRIARCGCRCAFR
jgi:hypothetical protein